MVYYKSIFNWVFRLSTWVLVKRSLYSWVVFHPEKKKTKQPGFVSLPRSFFSNRGGQLSWRFAMRDCFRNPKEIRKLRHIFLKPLKIGKQKIILTSFKRLIWPKNNESTKSVTCCNPTWPGHTVASMRYRFNSSKTSTAWEPSVARPQAVTMEVSKITSGDLPVVFGSKAGSFLTVDGSEIRQSPTGMYKILVNHGINYRSLSWWVYQISSEPSTVGVVKSCWWWRKIRRSPAEVGRLSHHLQGFSTIPGFRPINGRT